MMLKTCIDISCDSDISKIRKMSGAILARLTDEIPEISDDDLFELNVVYNELIANAIIHGNNNDISKKVVLQVRVDGDLVLSTIADEGNGFDYTEWFIYKNCSEASFSESGRGLIIVSSLTDSLAFNEQGNKVEFYKIITRHKKADEIEKEVSRTA